MKTAAIIEQKDATPAQRQIRELNAGFYCFAYPFLKENIGKIKKSPVSGEYYLTELVKLAAAQGEKIAGLKVPFREAGLGVNRPEELAAAEKLYQDFFKRGA